MEDAALSDARVDADGQQSDGAEPAPLGLCETHPAAPGAPPFAEAFGCHAPAVIIGACAALGPSPRDWCKGTGRHVPADLPCGACEDDTRECVMSVTPLCDHDGDGPQEPWLDDQNEDLWLCRCVDATWHCWIHSLSGSSCAGPSPEP